MTTPDELAVIRTAERVLTHCRFRAGLLVGYDQTEDGLDALFELYQRVNEISTDARSDREAGA